ncbi:alpha/beta hydrolase [Phaeobacter sp.]|uniref:alpha/beta fold hydrolase n=1 Tax=Phaeobacter sp. TaxID=1902409 RepID=UPI0025CFC2C3|nr:alpha/beta hydrolase [Phaeobacter sp.]
MARDLMELTSAPYLAELAEGPDGGAAHWVTTDDGLRIRVGHWHARPPEQQPNGATAKGTILLFPGRTEYIEKYGITASDLTNRGYTVVAIDWRGQGLADRPLPNSPLGHVERFSDYQRDVRASIKLVETLDLPKPWFLLGHSMGGAIGLQAVYEALPVKACVFSAPMWGIQIPAPLRPLANLLSLVGPGFGLASMRTPTTTIDPYVLATPFPGNALTNDADMYRLMQRQVTMDPRLAVGGPTVRWLTESIKACAQLARRPSPSLPCLTFLGTEEQIVNTDAIHQRMARWPSGELAMIDGAQHEVMMEDHGTRTNVFARIAAFFDQHRD